MEGIQTLKGSWPWPWPSIRPYGISSCSSHRPLPIYTNFQSNWRNFLWTDRRTDGRTDVRTGGRTFFPSILLGRLSEVDLNMGVFAHNAKVLEDGQGHFVAAKTSKKFHIVEDYVLCKFCVGFYMVQTRTKMRWQGWWRWQWHSHEWLYAAGGSNHGQQRPDGHGTKVLDNNSDETGPKIKSSKRGQIDRPFCGSTSSKSGTEHGQRH